MSPHVLVRGGTVFDGVAREGRRTDVRLADGVIAQVGDDLAVDGARVVPARDAWVVPGFVDAHSHQDLAVLSGRGMELRAKAGVTTEIVGQDGLGHYAVDAAGLEVMQEVLEPITGERHPTGWPGVGNYLGEVDRGAYARVAALVPHGAVRASVLGREPREATEAELTRMAALVAEGMHSGAVGLSSGLSYPPARFAATDELVALCAAMPAGQGRYVTHLRSYGAGLDAALQEAVQIGLRSGRPLHLSHFHVSGRGRAGTAGDVVAMLDAGVRDGLDLSWDSYPYLSGCTFLSSVLPERLQVLDTSGRLAALRGAEAAVIAAALDDQGPGPTVAASWDQIHLAGIAGTELGAWDGRTVADVARELGTGPGAVVVRVLAEHCTSACMVVVQGHPDNVRHIANDPRHVAGSDGIPGAGVPHPRASGTFLRFLRWARDGELEVSVADMVRRMTATPADLFGLPVGRLTPGSPADLLVLDPQRLSDGPDLGRGEPDAVRQSFIAGHPVVVDGCWTATPLPDLALRAGSTT